MDVNLEVTGKLMALQHIVALAYSRALPADEDVPARLQLLKQSLVHSVATNTAAIAAETGHAPAGQPLIEAYEQMLEETFSIVATYHQAIHGGQDSGSEER